MDIGRLAALPLGATRGAARRPTGAEPLRPGPGIDPFAPGRRARPAAATLQGELLPSSRGFAQSTQAYLEARALALDARERPAAPASPGVRHALDLYRDNLTPEPRQGLVRGRQVDEVV